MKDLLAGYLTRINQACLIANPPARWMKIDSILTEMRRNKAIPHLTLCGFSTFGIQWPRAFVHPSAYAQGQCALFAFTKTMSGPEFAAMPAMAQGRYRQEVRHLHQLFHVSTK